MNRVFAAMLADAPPPRRVDEDPDGKLEQAYRESAAALLAAFGQPGVLDRRYQGPLGPATGGDRLRIRLYDLLAHGWDLAQATGQPARLPDDIAEQALIFAREQLRDQARSGRFGPVQAVSDDASAIERLAAFLGRPHGVMASAMTYGRGRAHRPGPWTLSQTSGRRNDGTGKGCARTCHRP
jgi:uncharacterized protein (TIGR03086 family)